MVRNSHNIHKQFIQFSYLLISSQKIFVIFCFGILLSFRKDKIVSMLVFIYRKSAKYIFMITSFIFYSPSYFLMNRKAIDVGIFCVWHIDVLKSVRNEKRGRKVDFF